MTGRYTAYIGLGILTTSMIAYAVVPKRNADPTGKEINGKIEFKLKILGISRLGKEIEFTSGGIGQKVSAKKEGDVLWALDLEYVLDRSQQGVEQDKFPLMSVAFDQSWINVIFDNECEVIGWRPNAQGPLTKNSSTSSSKVSQRGQIVFCGPSTYKGDVWIQFLSSATKVQLPFQRT